MLDVVLAPLDRIARAIRLAALLLLASGAPARAAEALVLLVGDQHSAYERAAQLVAHVDRLRAAHPRLPMVFLINGDSLEAGNVVGQRTAGALDFSTFAALARRLPVVLNLGNHEGDFMAYAEFVTQAEAAGVRVIGNLADRASGAPYAPASTRVPLGATEAVIAGFTTDRLATYRVALRPALDLADPVSWGREYLPALLRDAPVAIVLSHAGIRADRELFPLVPAGTLFAGAHNHLRFVHPAGRVTYVHSGSWNDTLTLAWLERAADGAPEWRVEQLALSSDDPADPALAARIAATQREHLTADDLAPVATLPGALAPAAAARTVVAALRAGAQVDAVFIGNTTFGAGLPGGAVSRMAFDACVRFDGFLCTAEVDGATLRALLAAANHDERTPFAARHGEFLVAAGPAVAAVDDAARYRIATSDWGARNSRNYFGDLALTWQEHPELRVKALTLAHLTPTAPPPHDQDHAAAP